MMNHLSHLFLVVFFLFTSFLVNAQEKIDSTVFHFRIQAQDLTIDRHWELDYPMLNEVTLAKPNFDKNLFQGDWQKKIDPSYCTLYLPSNQSLHIYSSKVFNSFVLSDPLTAGFDFHLKPLMGWEKLDVYLFGQGRLFNQNLFKEYPPGIQLDEGRNLLMQIGVGVEYQITDRTSVYYQYSPVLLNKSFFGNRNKAVVHYRF